MSQRQTRTITVLLPTTGMLVRAPTFPVMPGQSVDVAGQSGNAGSVKMFINQVPPGPLNVAVSYGGFTLIAQGTALPLRVDVGNLEELWFAALNGGDSIIITVRDSGTPGLPAEYVQGKQAAPTGNPVGGGPGGGYSG